MEYISVDNQNLHLQGFSSDSGKYMYWSFTDSLVKTDMKGTALAEVPIDSGHLGDIDFYDGVIYASFLGQALPGHDWDDWTSFCVYMFAAEDLKLINILKLEECEKYFSVKGSKDDKRGFCGIDGITVGRDVATGERKLQIACGMLSDKSYTKQVILQYSLDGNFKYKYEKEYHIETGNTVFGIQNLDYDEETGRYWFTTYDAEKEYQAYNTLYCVDGDLKTILKKYHYSSPYGFDCIGGGKYYASLQSGENGRRKGYAYLCDASLFENNKDEREINEFILNIKE
jgi:hypothetical protein